MADTLARMKQLIGSTAEWAANDIVLGYGEFGIERVSASEYKAKVGDGTAKWSLLPYLTGSGSGSGTAVQAAIDGKVAKAGDTMTGLLILSGNAVAPMGAATKLQVDTVSTALTTGLAGKLDTAGGTLTGPLSLQGDPTSVMQPTPKQYTAAADALKVAKSGDTMTGALTLPADPVNPLEATTKQYVDGGAYQTVVGGSPAYAGRVVKLNAQGLIDNSLVSVSASYLGTVNVTVPYSLSGTYTPGDYFSVLASGTVDPTWASKINGPHPIASAGQFLIYNANGKFDLVGETTGAAALSAKLDKAGGTMTGPLALAADPTAALEAATKQYADKMVPLAGGTMTGLLTLSGDPTAVLGAATKQYVDTKVAGVTGFVAKAGDTMTGPLTLSGDATAALHAVTKQQADALDTASRTAWAAADTAITTAYQTADGNRVNKAGDTMTGLLTLSGAPTAALHAATKQYVDTADALKANLASPALTGNPTAPTQAPYTNDTTLATTAQVYTTVTTVPVSYHTGIHTLVLSDAGRMVMMNSGPDATITIPTEASVTFPVNTRIDIVRWGAGNLTIVGSPGVGINSADGKTKLRATYSGATLWKQAANNWLLIGDLA
jgi:hypothetical protein